MGSSRAFDEKRIAENRQALIQAAIEKVAESTPVYWCLFDNDYAPVFIPHQTYRFLSQNYSHSPLNDLENSISTALKRECCSISFEPSSNNSIEFDLHPPNGSLLCQASIIGAETGGPAWLLQFLPNGPTETFETLTAIGITGREAEILSYLPLGYSNGDIATAMEMSINGVKKHLCRIGQKLDAKGRTEILYKALMRKKELIMRYGALRN